MLKALFDTSVLIEHRVGASASTEEFALTRTKRGSISALAKAGILFGASELFAVHRQAVCLRRSSGHRRKFIPDS
jgi:predicted nucleic acid-binding protein